ncbi:MAG: phosphoribosylglycinamide formyltransferase [Salibacteraceae bacterium]
MNTIRIAIFASGTGTNADAISTHFKNHPKIEVALVVTSKHDAGVIKVAEKHGVDYIVLQKQDFQDENLVMEVLEGYEINYCVLAGWLLLIPTYLVKAFEGKMLNIHPALLPKFGGKGMYGKHVHEAVKETGESESGITIHQVNEDFDKGEIIAQIKVKILPDDSADEIERKVRTLELAHYADEIEKLIEAQTIFL